ncbi:MAG: hypothetical protein U9N07_02760 [Euryarchaeota archaeon]|nr:hypothetical protein [Euryarchaeota archaeon]
MGLEHTAKYDSDVIQKYADELEDRAHQLDQKAERMMTVYVILGVLIGFGIAASQTTNFVHVLATVGFGGFIGGAIADGRVMKLRIQAFQIRLQAQTALCQLQIEKNTRNWNIDVVKRDNR